MAGAAVLACLGGCGAKGPAAVPGVTAFRMQGPTLLVEAVVREPATASDAPVAVGQTIAAVGRAIHRGAITVPPDARFLVLETRLMALAPGGQETPVPWMAIRLDLPALERAHWHGMIAQQALDYAQSLRFVSNDAAAANAAFCADPAHVAHSLRYCRLVESNEA